MSDDERRGGPNLEDFAEKVAGRLLSDETHVLEPDSVPAAPAELTTRSLVAYVGMHGYAPDFRVRHTFLLGSKRAFRSLGVLLISQLLRPRSPFVRVFLPSAAETLPPAHPDSPLHPEQLLVAVPPELEDTNEMTLAVRSYRYRPALTSQWPWPEVPRDPHDLPSLHLTALDGHGGFRREEERALWGFGSLEGTARFARLLLDFSHPDSSVTEIVLESEPGVRGVAPTSHEITLALPGSPPFIADPSSEFATD